ncbi:MAG: uroporphyrinogen-III synthase [Actinomycetota bacterium]|nr:uroporphyrinogen-III synthase [Actinomycetota bacterium]
MTSPLAALRVVVTRAAGKGGELSRLLAEAGAEVVHVPTVQIVDPSSWDGVDRAVRALQVATYDWVLFTSINAVEKLVGRMKSLSVDASALNLAQVGAVGPSTQKALDDYGVSVDTLPGNFTAEDLVRSLGSGPGQVLLPRVEGGPQEIVSVLGDRGFDVDEVAVYRNVAPDADSPEIADLRRGRFDVVTFASASSARNFAAHVAGPADLGLGPDDPPDRVVACIGPQTARGARASGFRVDVEAPEHTARGLVDALIDFHSGREAK